MHRSGTSAVTRVLSLCGAALPQRIVPRNFGNPSGYWEPQRAVALNDEFARAHGSAWDDPGLALQLNPIRDEGRADFVARIAEFLRNGLRAGNPAVVKDPRITVLLPYWLSAARELGWTVKIVHAIRRPGDVAASLRAREGMESRLALALWLKYNLIGERDARGVRRVFLPYDQLVDDWEAVLRRCIETLELELAVREDVKRSIAAFMAPRLRHFSASPQADATIGSALRGWVERAHDVLATAANGVLRSAALDAIFREYVHAGVLAGAATGCGAISPVAKCAPHEP